MTVIIRLPDKQTAALKAKAAAEGLSLNAWLQKLAEQKRPARHRHITKVILDNMRDVPAEVTACIPKDGERAGGPLSIQNRRNGSDTQKLRFPKPRSPLSFADQRMQPTFAVKGLDERATTRAPLTAAAGPPQKTPSPHMKESGVVQRRTRDHG